MLSHIHVCTSLILKCYLARWEDAIEQVQAVIGDENTSGLPDQLVRDVVYNEWFDVPRSIERLLGEISPDIDHTYDNNVSL